MSIKPQEFAEFDHHIKIIELKNPKSGLLGYIAIHNVNAGPALGGTRIFPYKNTATALADALRLSKAMTYKCAIAGLPFGGGKGVIIANPADKSLPKILRAYAEAVDRLQGLFYTGEDVGLSEANVQYMLRFSPYFIGKSHLAGDPSPYAALSAFLCMQTAAKKIFGTASLAGRTVVVKGVGKTGGALVEKLVTAGAQVTIGDISVPRVKELQRKFKALRIIDSKNALSQTCDIYAPCALGNEFTKETAKKIKAKLICGTANNQLRDEQAAKILHQRGILYIPDYIANAGGLIDVADELLPGGFSKSRVSKNISKLKNTLAKIMDIAKTQHQSPSKVADEIAEHRFSKTTRKAILIKNKLLVS